MEGLPLLCPYCKGFAQLVDSKVIYKRGGYGMMYLCKPCNAYVGCHGDTNMPKGTLANKELRESRKTAHAFFDKIWKDKHLTRHQSYKWLAKSLNIQAHKCHIGSFGVEDCSRVVKLAKTRLIELEA
ncbi:MAG: hypothetical protein GQ570_03760 [Helicobacteraceae bacterium]|nr:hypothetical protein [Helicobacteraceae bacterium]